MHLVLFYIYLSEFKSCHFNNNINKFSYNFKEIRFYLYPIYLNKSLPDLQLLLNLELVEGEKFFSK